MQPVKEYTFDNFIVGSSNKFARMAAKAVADKPGETYNPLFIYGESGLGKTHLLNAIYNRISEQAPDTTISMRSADELTWQIVSALKSKQEELWYADLLSVDILLVDDMHVLVGKKATQEEIISLIRALVDRGQQVVMTSSVPSAKLPWFERGIRTGFEWGLFADIQPLDAETSKSIVLDKAARRGVQLSEEAVDNIVSRTNGEVRRIEGLINYALAEEKLMIKSYDLPNADCLRSFIKKYKGSIVGKELTAYRCSTDEGITPDPLVLSFGELSFIVDYYYLNELSIRVLDTALVEEDPTLNILYSDIPESRNVHHCCPLRTDHPFVGLKAEDLWFVVGRKNTIRDLLIRFEGDNVLMVCADYSFAGEGFMMIHKEVVPDSNRRNIPLPPGWKI